jgi:hypothetical protein
MHEELSDNTNALFGIADLSDGKIPVARNLAAPVTVVAARDQEWQSSVPNCRRVIFRFSFISMQFWQT